MKLDTVYKAHKVLQEVVRKTNLIPAPNLNDSCQVYLKTENLQVTGSFKYADRITRCRPLPTAKKPKA